ncbi:MAG: type II toxin-antitoxin system VapC family toxin [Candidatus Bipolaricaulia bacterium]
MVTPVVVDSDTLIDYFGGYSPLADAVERLIENDRLAVTTVTLFELASGAQSEAQRTDVETLTLASRLLPLDLPSAMRGGQLYRDLRATGNLLETADLLIAACCLSRGLPLLTRNRRHFERIADLRLLSTRQGVESRMDDGQ